MIDLRCGDCLEVMKTMEHNSVDLTVTSPPYDNLRTYNGYTFNFEGIAQQLYRVTKQGGVVVWVVGDATIKGSETGTSFKQALYFKEIGFNLHDTMIWNKKGFSAVGSLVQRYAPVYEYMFIFSKGKIKTFNPIKDRKNKWAGKTVHGTIKDASRIVRKVSGGNKKILKKYGQRFNIWDINPDKWNTHPAPFPEDLSRDHIISWSNPGDTVLDPMMGSGTTGKMAKLLKRNFIGIEISPEYFELAGTRINTTQEMML